MAHIPSKPISTPTNQKDSKRLLGKTRVNVVRPEAGQMCTDQQNVLQVFILRFDVDDDYDPDDQTRPVVGMSRPFGGPLPSNKGTGVTLFAKSFA